MKKQGLKIRTVKEWAYLSTGCLIYGLSTVLIEDVNVIPGSFLGIALSANKVFGVSAGTINLLLNIPVMILIAKKLGAKVAGYTVFILICTSVLVDRFTAAFQAPVWNVYILAALSGVIMGVAAGLLIAADGTMAGTTALTRVIKSSVTGFSFGTIQFILDGLIILSGTILLQDWRAIPYSMLYSFCCTSAIDAVLALDRRLFPRSISVRPV